jgi:riboflavin kinase/FMN adenylyltransferase
MEYIAGNTNFKFRNSAVTLGKFDGIHLGHQLLLDKVISFKQQGYLAIMFSFLYHPGNLFSDKEFEMIYSEDEKVAKLRQMDMDVLISYPFTEATRSIEPEDFIKDILVGQMDAKVIVVGNDFRFGRNRRGDIELLKQYENVYGYQLIACEKRTWKDEIISSSSIRNKIKEGNIKDANEMLGQPYFIMGKVLHGRKIGRTLGMPTVNLVPMSNKLLPPCGVYATKTIVDGVAYEGVTNIGYKPTVGEEKQKGVETYIFDFDQDLYGKEIMVELYNYQRPELKFDTIEELKEKMHQDIVIAKKYFAG